MVGGIQRPDAGCLGRANDSSFQLPSTEPCNLNFTDPEANIEILLQPDYGVECNYLITVYLGYGIEVQVSASICVYFTA